MSTINIEELAEKAKAFDRLQSIAPRRNATGVYAVVQSPERILSLLEQKQDEEDANISKSRAHKAARQARIDAETAALALFKIGQLIQFNRWGVQEEGQVAQINHEGLLAPNLGIYTGSIGQKALGTPLYIKPIEHQVNGLKTYMDGDQWCCVDGTFVDLQESPAGFGVTEAEAVGSFVSEVLK